MIEPLGTFIHRLFVARGEADEDASPIDLTTAGDFAQMPDGTLDLSRKDVVSPQDLSPRAILRQNGVAFSFTGGAAAGKTFTWNLYAWRNENGPARHVAQGTGILGTQAVVAYPHNGETATNKFWADTLVVDWFDWYKRVAATTPSTARNSVSEIWLDAWGHRYWRIEIADADGKTGTKAGDIAVFYGFI